jgi:hypothetical protein
MFLKSGLFANRRSLAVSVAFLALVFSATTILPQMAKAESEDSLALFKKRKLKRRNPRPAAARITKVEPRQVQAMDLPSATPKPPRKLKS